MKALITGITGFAGRFLAEHLVACGDQVMGTVRDRTRLPRHDSSWPDSIHVLPWDLATHIPAETRSQIAQFAPETIFHLASISRPADCGGEQPHDMAVRVNVEGTRSVIQLALSLGSPARLVFASSAYVYRNPPTGRLQVTEDAPQDPTSAYGKTKLWAEKEVIKAINTDGLDGVILRAFQHTGPRQPAHFMLPEWTAQLVRGTDPLPVLSLDSHLDLSDVRDVVRAYRHVAQSGNPHTVLNVGSGRSWRSGDVLELLLRTAGSNHRIQEIHPGVRAHPIADIGRITATTAWAPEIPLEQTVRDTLDYWRKKSET